MEVSAPNSIWIVIASCASTLVTTAFGLFVRRWFNKQEQKDKNESVLLRAMPAEERRFLEMVVTENRKLRERHHRQEQRELLLQGKIRQLQQRIYMGLYRRGIDESSEDFPDFPPLEEDPDLDLDNPDINRKLDQIMRLGKSKEKQE
jgi:hypothetical protein